MAKTLRQAEFEVNASPKIIFPYLNTAGGLTEWFADDVTINSNKVYNFLYDGEEHLATMVSQKQNKSVKFQYIDDEDDPSWFEFDLQVNELTQTMYMHINEYSDSTDSDEEFEEMWEGLVDALRDVVGA